MIPDLNPATGHLPRGRYLCDLQEIEERFVTHADFASSTTRRAVWTGLLDYLGAWDDAEAQLRPHLPGPLLLAVWFGGSFISGRADPRNVDLTVLAAADSLRAATGHPGAGKVNRLSYRDGMLSTYRVSPVVLRYEPVARVFRSEGLMPHERDYLIMRGAWDDWWQRVRAPGVADAKPTIDTAVPVRGYLEVVL